MVLTMFSAGHASEDARLVRAAREGDEGAFGALYERYARVIHGVLLARAPRADIEDLVQDVFLSAWNRLEFAARSCGVRRMAVDDRAKPGDRFSPPGR